MKWVTIISIIVLVAFAESRDVHRASRDAEHKSNICKHFQVVGEEKFKSIILVHISQHLPQSSCDDLVVITREVLDLAQKCCADESSDPHCLAEEVDIFQDKICASQSEVDKNEWVKECCNKAADEKHECFVKKRPTTESHGPFIQVSKEEQCKHYAENRVPYMGNFICTAAKRRPKVPATNVLINAFAYTQLLDQCCVKENKDECFQTLETKWKQNVKERGAVLKSYCQIVQNYGVEVLQAKKLAELSKKVPNADFNSVIQLVQHVTDLHKTCCEGDMINCMVKRNKLIDGVCANNEILTKSQQLSECCKQSPILRSLCIDKMSAEHKPADLADRLGEYVEDPEICKKYEAGKREFLAKFLYEFSRRHTKYSDQLLLRIAKGYEELLEQCCKTDDPPKCYAQAEGILQTGIGKNEALVKTRCELYKAVGQDAFENIILAVYTKKMPQASFEGLREMSKALATVGTKCCTLEESDRMACSEELVTIVVSSMCDRIDASVVNPKVVACCKESYSRVRPCVSDIDHDETFVPAPFSDDQFIFHADLCTLPHDRLQERKARLIYNLARQKPSIDLDQIKKNVHAFYTLLGTCCKSPTPEECFSTEGPKTVAQMRELLHV